MGNRVMELMDNPLMSTTHRLRQLQHMGKLHMQLHMGSLQRVRASTVLHDFVFTGERA